MKKGKQVLYVFITVISIAIIGIFIGKDMTATDDKIIQVMFENENITEESIDIHAQSQCLDDYEIKAMQVDDQPKVDNVTEVDFTATENRDYIVKVYYQSLIKQEELIETFTTTVNSIGNYDNDISLLAENQSITAKQEDFVVDADGVITEYRGSKDITELVIPNKINDITVIGIVLKSFPDGVFAKCEKLVSVKMPDSITFIGDSAFFGCTSLTSITMGNSVERIGDFAFSNCFSLKDIQLPNSLKRIGIASFQKCRSLREIDIPDSVVSIGYDAFVECDNLTTVHLSHQIKTLSVEVFGYCPSIKKIVLPNSVKYIEWVAFGSSGVETVYLPYTVERLRESAFNDTRIKNVIVMCNDPNNIELQDNSVLHNIEKAANITLPLDWYRAVLTGDVNVKQNAIHFVKGQGRVMNLKNIFEDNGIKEVIYKGKTGTELYTGNDIEIPKDYLKLEEGTDISMKYQIVGTPSSPDTKIIGDKLYIAADETASDLKVTANVLSTTKEVPITIVPIDSIAIKNGPQSTYTDGEIYNPKGLIITVTYKDGYQEDIVYSDENKTDFTFKYEKLDLTTPKQIITYKGFSIEQNLTIQNRYIDKVLIHDDLKIEVKGKFTENSYIIVEKRKEIDTEFYKKLDDKKVIGNYEVRVIGDYKDDLFIVFDVGEKYNHKKAYIRHLKQNGSIETYEKIILNGKVGITVNELSPFVIYIESDIYHDLNNDIYDQASSQINNLPNIHVEENKSRQSVMTLTDDNTNMIGYILLAGMSLLLMRIRKKRSKI